MTEEQCIALYFVAVLTITLKQMYFFSMRIVVLETTGKGKYDLPIVLSLEILETVLVSFL